MILCPIAETRAGGCDEMFDYGRSEDLKEEIFVGLFIHPAAATFFFSFRTCADGDQSHAISLRLEGVTGWETFEPAVTKAEAMDSDIIWHCAAEIPEEWYEGDRDGLNRLVEALHPRRGAIRKLITDFRRSSRNPFPNWRESSADSAIPLAVRDRSLEAQHL